MAKGYRWAHPSEWLQDQIDGCANTGNIEGLRAIAVEMLSKLDGDEIQDLFQSDMDQAGYFRKVRGGRYDQDYGADDPG